MEKNYDILLIEAIDNHNLKTAETILKSGKATLYRKYPHMMCHTAAYGETDEIELLVKYGGDPHIDNDNPVRCAATMGRFKNVLHMLSNYGVNCNIEEFVKNYVLIATIDLKNLDWFKFFSNKYHINLNDQQLINYALVYGNREILNYFISKNVDIDGTLIIQLLNSDGFVLEEDYREYLNSLIE